MFNSLTGTITGKFPKQLFLETSGIEWLIQVPDSCLNEFGSVGSSAKVFTYLNHYENGMDLYGFATDKERSLFFDLLKVDGIGPKAAIKIMSSVSPQELFAILEAGDVSVLEKIPGIGKKTAAKMLLALKGKLTIPQETTIIIKKENAFEVVVSSLCEMGYDRLTAEKTVGQVAEELSKNEDFAKKTQAEKEDSIFKKAIMEIAR